MIRRFICRDLTLSELHHLLRRQLKRYFGEPFRVPEDWQGVLARISDVYQDYDTRLELMERSLVLGSQELHQANAEMQAVFQAIPDLLFRLDSQGVILNFKAGSGKDVLYPDKSYVGKRFQGVPSKPLAQQLQAAIQSVLATRASVSLEYALTLQNQVQSYEARLMPLDDDQLVVMVRNTTERKHADAQLAAAHLKLLEASRQAGASEVATGVLHNVGNALNSLNVSAMLMVGYNKKSRIPFVGKVAALLNEHGQDLAEFLTADPKGKLLPRYLGELAEQLAKEQQAASVELEVLRKNLEHIAQIVAMQQAYGKISGFKEIINASVLVEDALRLEGSSSAGADVELVRDYADVPPVAVEKHKVLQILVNLLRNARHACNDSGRKDKQLRIQLSQADDAVRIAIIDNGIGIPPENLTRIFNYGFTTRQGGHGFGLHNGALAARELGGSLTAQSEGLYHGATFTLELPTQAPKSGSELE